MRAIILALLLVSCAAPGETRQQAAMRIGCLGARFQPIATSVLVAFVPGAAPGVAIETATLHRALVAYCAARGEKAMVMMESAG
jgi:hypothetical protein